MLFFSYEFRVSGGYDSLSSRTECNVGVSPALGRNLQVWGLELAEIIEIRIFKITISKIPS